MIRIRFTYTRGAELKYLSHLDLARLFHRALRRTALPLAYTEGFNPHPRLNLAVPLPVGVTASREYGEIFFTEPLSPALFLESMRGRLPAGLELTGAAPAEPDQPSLAAVINAALYRAVWSGFGSGQAPGAPLLQESLDRLLSRESIAVRRRGKGGQTAETDIRPYILNAELRDGSPPGLSLLLQVGSRGGVSPFPVLAQLELGEEFSGEYRWLLHRQGLYIYRGKLEEPFPEGGD